MCSATSVLAGIEMRLEFTDTRSLGHLLPFCPWQGLKGSLESWLGSVQARGAMQVNAAETGPGPTGG